MQKLKISYLLILTILFSSCGLDRMASKYETLKFTVTPPILQTHAGKVQLSINTTFPPKYFDKNATIEFTPVLVYANGETAFKTMTVQGEEANGGAATIFYENGGSCSYQENIDYKNDMKNSNLEIRAYAKLKDKVKDLGSIKLAEGVIATSKRVLDTEKVANENHGYEHETILEEKASIYFLVNDAKIRTTEKSDDDIKRIKEFVKNGYKTHSIEIMSYASPEGSINTNTNVSDNRMKSTVKYTQKLLQSLKVDGAKKKDLYSVTSIGEDWKGFERLITSSKIKDKRIINRIVNSVEDLELREQQIRDLSEVYDAISDNILPQLRKAVIIIRAYEPKRTDEEIHTLSKTKPDSLTVEELLFAATLTKDNKLKTNIYNSVVEIHNDWRGYNNLACIHISKGELDKASMLLEKAENISNKKRINDILINQGIIASRKGELDKAQKLFNKGLASDLNQAILDIRQGDYTKSARYFKKQKSHNAVLAQIMNGNNNVKCNENTAECHYLNAISATRKGDNKTAINSLKQAIVLNQSYKLEALIDLEFINLRANSDFINLTSK